MHWIFWQYEDGSGSSGRHLGRHVAAESGAADDKALAIADGLADLIQPHNLQVQRDHSHACTHHSRITHQNTRHSASPMISLTIGQLQSAQ